MIKKAAKLRRNIARGTMDPEIDSETWTELGERFKKKNSKKKTNKC